MINKEKVVEVLVLWLFASKVLDGATLFQILEDESSIDFRRVAQPVGVVDCEKIEDPFLVLIYFLHLFSRFEWSKWAVCSTGLIPLHPEMSEEIKGSQKVTGRLGDCDSALTSIVYDCRKSLGLDIDQHSDSTIVATSSIDSCSNFAGHQSVEGDHSGFDSLPSDHRNGEVCVLHPLKKGFNLCRKKRATIRASKSGKDGNVTPPIEEFVQISAIQEIFATGFKQITSTIRALTRQETGPGCASASDVRGRASMMPMKIVEHCFPQLFKSSKGSINHSSSCVESTQLDSGRDLLQISSLVPTNRADIYSNTVSYVNGISRIHQHNISWHLSCYYSKHQHSIFHI